MDKLDKKDCIILNILQENCRTSLTNIAKQVNLSIDSVKKRLNKLENKKIFSPKVQIKPRSFGFENIVDVKIRLFNHSEEDIHQLIKYAIDHPKIPEIFRISGEWDLSLVIISKNADDLGNITSEIKNKFGKIIGSWNESITLKSYKFETYDMSKLMGFEK